MWQRLKDALALIPRWVKVATLGLASLLCLLLGLRALWRRRHRVLPPWLPGRPERPGPVGIPVLSPAEADRRRTAIVQDYQERVAEANRATDAEIKELDEWLEGGTDTDTIEDVPVGDEDHT